MSYYLKYRPQTVSQLDLNKAREALERVLKSGTLMHAFLFAGPKGTGKTSSARIMAKTVNCVLNKDHQAGEPFKEPCGKCEQCRRIAAGSSLAVIEMDAASNRGIDDIRELRERVNLAPSEGDYTVYVIDEVHMLTNEAFNALLKTLEEPPPHAIFVLCTTEAEKLPDTVVSRCMLVEYAKASADEVTASLQKAVKGEALTIDPKALHLLATRVDGSFRDGMKLLEQLAQTGKPITESEVDEITGYTENYQPGQLIELLLRRQVAPALQEIKQREDIGVDMALFGKRVLEQVQAKWRQAVMEGNAGPALELAQMGDELVQAVTAMKLSPVVSAPLEIMVVEWCLKDATPALLIPKNDPEPQPPRMQVVPSPVTEKKVAAKISSEVPAANQPDEKVKMAPAKTASVPVSFETIKTRWLQLLSAVRPHNHSLEALLRASKPYALDGNRLTIEVFFNFHKEQLEQERHRKVIEQEIYNLYQCPLQLYFVLGKRDNAVRQLPDAPEVVNVTGKVEDEGLAQAAEEIFS